MKKSEITIQAIRVTNGKQVHHMIRERVIRKKDLEKYRRRLSRLMHGNIDFTIKSY